MEEVTISLIMYQHASIDDRSFPNLIFHDHIVLIGEQPQVPGRRRDALDLNGPV